LLLTVYAKPVDDDNVTTPSALAINSNAAELRYGRMIMENAYGPENEDLAIRLNAEYADDGRFLLNTQDNCSGFDKANLTTSGDFSVIAETTASALQQGQTPQQSFVLK